MRHAQLQMGHFPLNFHLSRIGVIGSSDCQCGHPTEDVEHYLLECPLYIDLRNELQNVLLDLNVPMSVDVLLTGSDRLSYDNNKIVFPSVHNYIRNSGRFATTIFS